MAEKQWRYESQFKRGNRVQTAPLGFGSLITGGVVTGFDKDGYPVVKWDDGQYEGKAWTDEDLRPYEEPTAEA